MKPNEAKKLIAAEMKRVGFEPTPYHDIKQPALTAQTVGSTVYITIHGRIAKTEVEYLRHFGAQHGIRVS